MSPSLSLPFLPFSLHLHSSQTHYRTLSYITTSLRLPSALCPLHITKGFQLWYISNFCALTHLPLLHPSSRLLWFLGIVFSFIPSHVKQACSKYLHPWKLNQLALPTASILPTSLSPQLCLLYTMSSLSPGTHTLFPITYYTFIYLFRVLILFAQRAETCHTIHVRKPPFLFGFRNNGQENTLIMSHTRSISSCLGKKRNCDNISKQNPTYYFYYANNPPPPPGLSLTNNV